MTRPFVSLVTPVYNSPPAYLDALLASVREQMTGSWELILSDDGSNAQATRRWLDTHVDEKDVTILRNAENRGIAAASNAAILVARAPWIAFLDHDDTLAPYALERVHRALTANPDCEFLYTDEVITDAHLRPLEFFFKPAFDIVLLSGVNFINHLSVYRRNRVLALDGLREGFDGSQDYDLVLRYTKGLKGRQILHLPYPAYIWRRDGRSFSALRATSTTKAARRALADTFGLKLSNVGDAEGGLHRIFFEPETTEWPLVSIIVPSRNAHALMSRLLLGLYKHTDYPHLEIIVVDNGSDDHNVHALYNNYASSNRNFSVIRTVEVFNFSRSVNRGILQAVGRFILLLNNDIEIVTPGWLKEMVQCFSYPDVGIVGAKLLYPDKTLQHAGVIVGFGGLAGHWYVKMPPDFPGPMGRLRVRQTLSAVTGACFLISKDCIHRVGMFDESSFAIAYNDVDFCLRAKNAGFRVIWTPFSTLVHHESASRGSDETDANKIRFQREKENLRVRHATEAYEDSSISPWYTRGLSHPEWRRLEHLPAARSEQPGS